MTSVENLKQLNDAVSAPNVYKAWLEFCKIGKECKDPTLINRLDTLAEIVCSADGLLDIVKGEIESLEKELDK